MAILFVSASVAQNIRNNITLELTGGLSTFAYDTNFVTNQTLKKHGIKVIEIPSCELSRGRGGPHCMSMALSRRNEE